MDGTIAAMRKIVFQSSVSLDGFIEGPNGELDWLMAGHRPADVLRLVATFDTIFYGRKMYEALNTTRIFERTRVKMDKPLHDPLYGVRKYVFSRTEKHVEGNAMVVGDGLASEVERIRAERGKNICFRGGADILKTFAGLDLVDEYVLSVHPVLLRAGKPLFPESQFPTDLKLMQTYKTASGIAILHYQPGSKVKPTL